jgi:beta-N-acetylhexosaminidase
MKILSAIATMLIGAAPLYSGWAEDVLEKMSLEEKIGQLFIVPACPQRNDYHLEDLHRIISDYHIGGVILKQGDPFSQIALINNAQSFSAYPLLCVGDAEWGLSMRLENTLRFPRNLTLGAIQDKALIYKLGYEIGRECKKTGLHINLAPVVDVNINPKNPIIHMRSFGEDPQEVADCGRLYMQGLQDAGVLACAKHFIGHGDTRIDSHKDLPIVSHPLEHLESIELFPFKKLIEGGVSSVMMGHLRVPALDVGPSISATLSPLIVKGLLKEQMNFKGLVITDALNMQALSRYFPVGEIAVKALIAGNDLLLYGDHLAPNIDRILEKDIPDAFSAIKQALEEEMLSEAELDEHVLKILKAKEALQLNITRQVPVNHDLMEDLNSWEAKELKSALFKQALTLVENNDHLLPLSLDKETSISLVQIGGDDTFRSILSCYANVESFSMNDISLFSTPGSNQLFVVVAIYDISLLKEDFGISQDILSFLGKMKERDIPFVLTIFGTPYCLSFFHEIPALIIAYENDPEASIAAAEMIFGKIKPQGKLPVSVSPNYPRGMGLSW